MPRTIWTSGLDDTERERIEKSVAVVNAVYGAPARIAMLADDLVAHWEDRRASMGAALGTAETPFVPGKALVVGATREICARLYDALVERRPDWHSDEAREGSPQGGLLGLGERHHARRPARATGLRQRGDQAAAEEPGRRFLEIVIVKDMMLTGFDSPPLHTLYLDRPLKGALLMQTLARVNRTFRGKQDGLLVAYAPLADNLHAALAEYTVADQEARPVGRPVDESVDLVGTLLDRLDALLDGYDWRARLRQGDRRAYVAAVLGAVDYLRRPDTPPVTAGDDEEPRVAAYRREAGRLARAWAIAGRADALHVRRPEAQFFEEVRVWIGKFDAEDRQARGEPVPDDVQRLLNQARRGCGAVDRGARHLHRRGHATARPVRPDAGVPRAGPVR
ncbi:type I restriction enzyme endonuclease domain-containing protein [Cellulomonas sp.]|uniref:type I restriction enzyme subunit R domain-containing protein n=1 Tax=Cellulomonas sp. TaxID=40001 RepID=UPI00338E365D